MTDQPTEPPAPRSVPVCAIGASAGGVGALQTLFRLLPDDLGLAYVVVIHLAPDHPSALHEILGGATRMPVLQVTDGPTLKPNCVYVIAPDSELVIDRDNVHSRPFTNAQARRAPIDMFFRSVAAGRGDGIAVVLTGAGSDGAVGVRAIKEAGGLIMVQEPAEAGYPSMPQNVIATGVADVIAPLARLAERIAEAARSKEAVRSLDGDGAANDVRRIIAFLRMRTGHDFSGYKRSTVLRRITRRMQVCQIDNLADYARHLRDTPEETEKVFADLLISVTTFFRDPDAFAALSHAVIRPLLETMAAGGDADSDLRAWVVGCATGEEAYSLAILLLEEAERLRLHIPIQIFATDLDEGALATAREGRYPRTVEADVSAERLKRFFVDEGTHYRIHRRVRDLVLFATHSVVREPPFMRLDLITCRNVLIYLERALQQHVCGIFHYGLKPNGALFLGPAEAADASQSQFAVIDREARIYRALPSETRLLPLLTTTSVAGPTQPAAQARNATARFDTGEGLGASHATALEVSAPPSALVDAEHMVLHLSPSAGRFILLSAGPLSGKLPTIVRPELRLDLKVALDRVLESGQPTITRVIDVPLDGTPRRVSLHVVPVPATEGSAPRAMVFFLDSGPGRPAETADNLPPPDELLHLHGELKAAQEAELAGRIRHDTAVQELRASNEELQSLNEEYRSTAEELETSKEELQSINEELQTVNAELKNKLSVISAAHNDLQNLTASSEIGTLFLDTALRIRMFTPRVADLINITAADAGRPITDFTHRFDYDGIERDVRRVLGDFTPIETEVRSLDGRWFAMRVRPYRTLEDRVEGAVVTFDDTTARRQAEVALRESEAQYRDLFNSIDEGFCIIEVLFDAADQPVDYRFLTVNGAFEHQTGLRDVVGRTIRALVPDHEAHWFETFGRIVRSGRPERFEDRAEALDRWYDVFAFRFGAPEKRQVAVLFKDVLARRQAEELIRSSEERFRAFVTASTDVVYRMSPDWSEMRQLEGRSFLRDTGQPSTDWLDTYIHPDDQSVVRTAIDRAIETRSMFELEHRVIRADGTLGWTLSRAVPILDDQGPIREWLGAASDVTDRIEALQALRESEAVRRMALVGGRMGTWRLDLANHLIRADAQSLALWGLPPSDGPQPSSLFTTRMSPANAIEVDDLVAKAVEAGEEFDGEWEIVSGPAAGRWIRWRGRAAADNPSLLYGITFDVTEQKQADARLRASEGRLRAVFEQAPMAIAFTGPDGEILFRNTMFDRLWGREPHDTTARTYSDVYEGYHLDGRPIASEAWPAARALLRDETVRGEVLEIVNLQGERVACSFDAGPIHDADGQAIGAVVMFRNITEELAAQRALRASEERQRTLVEGVPQLVWRAGAGGEWTWSSPQWTAYTGLSEAESRGLNWLAALHPDDRSAAAASWSSAHAGDALTMETRIYNAREGRYRWFASRATPVRDAGGRVTEWLGTSTDIHDLRELQGRQGVLVAELQHRTRNLMSVVRATMENTLRSSTGLEDFAGRYRDRIDALSRVQGMLSRLNNGDRITFDQLIGDEIEAIGASERVSLVGPPGVALRSSTVQTFALALHELATNAVKYGALAQPNGRLAITWHVEPGGPDGRPWLYVDWHESGVAVPSTGTVPQGSGQGRQLIERALPYQLGARTTYVMGPDGVRCSIAVPVSNRAVPEGSGE